MAGLAAGIVTAASIWNLIIPAIGLAGDWGQLAFLPVFAGTWWGFLMFLIPKRWGWKAVGMLLLVWMGISAMLGIPAGAALYLVVKKLIPRMAGEKTEDAGTIWFAVGFTLVMVLDAIVIQNL